MPDTSALPRSDSRQLIVLCDGTNNNLTGGVQDTNVVLLCELFAAHPDPRRVVFYDPGVGNSGTMPSASFWDAIQQYRDRVMGLAQGRGIFENIAEGYLFLMRHWQPGDQILVFGFSRGAFTARSLAGMVNKFGLLRAHQDSVVPSLVQAYFADTTPRREAVAEQATRLFADGPARQVPIDFVGVWDTVAAVGMPPLDLKITALPTLKGKRFVNVRHALALDEHRAQFKPRLYAENNGPFKTAFGTQGSIQQLWFRGAHGDSGGGYPPGESALAQQALCWLVSEAVRCGMVLHDGSQPLDTEAAVAQALTPLPSLAGKLPSKVLMHDELHDSPLWALTGMMQRETTCVRMDNDATVAVQPQEHPSVALLASPETVWSLRGQGSWKFAAALLAAALLFFTMGQMHTGFTSTGTVPGDLAEIWRQLPAYWHANATFQGWQFLHAGDGAGNFQGWIAAWRDGLEGFQSPLGALTLDLLFIAAYTFALGTLAVRAFARRSGLRRAGDPISHLLACLGWALPLLVASDVVEDLLCAAVVVMLRSGMDVVPAALGAAMAMAGLTKWAGLFGVLALIVLGLLPARRQDGA